MTMTDANTTPTEASSLLPTKHTPHGSMSASASTSSSPLVSKIFFLLQALLFVFFASCTTTSYPPNASAYDVKEYIAFRDIMAMLLLGFGYLMTFLKHYGIGAVGFTMMLSILSMELNIAVEYALRLFYESITSSSSASEVEDGMDTENTMDTSWPMPITMATLIDAEFAAATLMITFGALIGRATPLQMTIIAICQSFFYAFNKVLFVLGMVAAEDVGGSMTIHMFGAYFGLAVSYALRPAANKEEEEDEHCSPDKVSDLLALIGTTILWVFWPSFVGATETGIPSNEQHCVINTIFALMASTAMTFYLSQKLNEHGKWDPVHVANSTLAGGVAIGSAGRLNIGPGMAVLTGALAGAASVCGYMYSTPRLQEKFGIFDTCGVGNLHGYPSVVGAILSIFFVALDSKADFLLYSDTMSQMVAQLGGILVTLIISISSGYVTGMAVKPLKDDDNTPNYLDSTWWHLEY